MNGMNAFYTHQQYLIKELRKLDYSQDRLCLELGSGDGSASVFRGFLIDNPHLYVWALDASEDWRDQIKRDYHHPNYEITLVRDWGIALDEGILNGMASKSPFDLVFIDQSPFDARIMSIDILGKYSKVIVLHDYDYFNKGVCENIFSVGEDSFFAKYANDFILEPHCMILPPTLIMRNKNL